MKQMLIIIKRFLGSLGIQHGGLNAFDQLVFFSNGFLSLRINIELLRKQEINRNRTIITIKKPQMQIFYLMIPLILDFLAILDIAT